MRSPENAVDINDRANRLADVWDLSGYELRGLFDDGYSAAEDPESNRLPELGRYS